MLYNNGKIVKTIDRACCCIPFPKSKNLCFYNHRPAMSGPGVFSLKLKEQMRKFGIDVTYRKLRSSGAALLFSTSWGDWFYRFCREWKVKTVLRIDGFMVPTYFDNRKQPIEHQDRRLTIEKMELNHRVQRDLCMSDIVIYQSKFSKDMIDTYLYKRNEKYTIIYNGIDLEMFHPIQKKRNDGIILMIGGCLRDEYMMDTVLDVYKTLFDNNVKINLLVVGTLDKISQMQLDNFIKRHKVEGEKIKICEPVAYELMPRFFQMADIYIHPRLGDWCPNIVIESLACGIPVVCGSWGGASELIGNGGEVVKTGQWSYGKRYKQELTEAVIKVAKDLESYKVNARKRAESEYDIKLITSKYLECMDFQVSTT